MPSFLWSFLYVWLHEFSYLDNSLTYSYLYEKPTLVFPHFLSLNCHYFPFLHICFLPFYQSFGFGVRFTDFWSDSPCIFLSYFWSFPLPCITRQNTRIIWVISDWVSKRQIKTTEQTDKRQRDCFLVHNVLMSRQICNVQQFW